MLVKQLKLFKLDVILEAIDKNDLNQRKLNQTNKLMEELFSEK